jgi:LysR family transcriptional regulator, chromosome initiation inhibitor
MSLLDPQLQAFMAITRLGTVHAAAESLFLTQTAVTTRIKMLEQKLKVSLFSRTRRGMLLTPEGETLLRYCQTVEDLSGETLSQLQGAGTQSAVEISITGATSVMRSRIIPDCVPVMQAFKSLYVNFDISDNSDAINKMRRADAQLAVIPDDALLAEMASKSLKPERYVMVGPVSWRGRRLKDIVQHEKIIDFNSHDRMTFDYLKQYDLYPFASHERHFANRTEALATLIIAGLGYTVLTFEFAKRYVDRGEMVILNQQKVMLKPLSLVWYPRPEPTDYFTALVDAIH